MLGDTGYLECLGAAHPVESLNSPQHHIEQHVARGGEDGDKEVEIAEALDDHGDAVHSEKNVSDLSDLAVWRSHSANRIAVHAEGSEIRYGSYADKLARLHASQPRTHSALGHSERGSDAAVARARVTLQRVDDVKVLFVDRVRRDLRSTQRTLIASAAQRRPCRVEAQDVNREFAADSMHTSHARDGFAEAAPEL